MTRRQKILFIAVFLIPVFIAGLLVLKFKDHAKRYIFIDGGAHKGETIAHFEKTKMYRDHPWEIYAFEANPHLMSFFPERHGLTVLNQAIWNQDGFIEFYLGEDSLSSSLIKDKKTGNLRPRPVRVPCVDFGQWLKKNFSIYDYILVKLDIEGAEYDVLDKMLSDGTIAYVDKLYIEFHNTEVNVPVEKDKEIFL